jgi:hypothetical protein
LSSPGRRSEAGFHAARGGGERSVETVGARTGSLHATRWAAATTIDRNGRSLQRRA